MLRIATLFLALASSGAALAASERIETCADLYVLRNDFFHKKGLCFTRPGAQQVYKTNQFTCDPSLRSDDIPITERQRQALRKIQAAEAALACPRP